MRDANWLAVWFLLKSSQNLPYRSPFSLQSNFYQISIIKTIFCILSHFREIKLEIKSRETTETTPGINNVFSVSTGLGKKLKILEIK